MIGIYDYTVILTYGGLFFALLGMIQALGGHFHAALLCMCGALFCDTFDGIVARSKRDRTQQEQMFGIQIDSLCDVISFGVFPALMCYMMGARGMLDIGLLGYYCLCCVIRLGYFNVLAIEREPGEKCVYHGLPVVGFAMLMPAVMMVRLWVPASAFLWILRGMLVLFGTLYILDVEIKKPGAKLLPALGLLVLIPLSVIFLFR